MVKRLDFLSEVLAKGLAEKVYTHAGVALGNLVTSEREYVFAGARCSSVFDLASMTKAFSTAFLVHKLTHDNKLSLDSSVNEVCEKLGISFAFSELIGQQSISALLGHRSNFPAWACLWINRLGLVENLWEDRDNYILSHLSRVLDTRPSQKPCYSDLGYITLGLLVEKACGLSQDEVFSEAVGQHLDGFVSYLPLRHGIDKKDTVSTGYCNIRERELSGEVHDENCASLGGVSGHAGLFGTLGGCCDILEFFYREDNRHYLNANAAMIDLREKFALEGDGLSGMRQNVQQSITGFADGKAIGHLGFTGTSFYINPKTQDYVIFLTNRVKGGRLSQGIADYRKKVHDFAQIFFNERHLKEQS